MKPYRRLRDMFLGGFAVTLIWLWNVKLISLFYIEAPINAKKSFHSKMSKLGLTTAVFHEDYSDAVPACSLTDIDTDGLRHSGSHSQLIRDGRLPQRGAFPENFFQSKCLTCESEEVQRLHLLQRCTYRVSLGWWPKRQEMRDEDSVKAEEQTCVGFTFECTGLWGLG